MGACKALLYAALNFFGGFIYSYNNSIISGMSKSLVQCTLFEPGEVDVSMFQSILTAAILLGATFGAPLGTWACSTFSRKTASYIVSVIGIVVPIITLAWTNYYYLCIMRFLVGIAMGMAASIFPLYTVEITEPKYKSTVGSVFGVAVGAGVVIAVSIQQCVNLLTPSFETECQPLPEWNWRVQIGLAALWGLTTLLITYYSPESPIDVEKKNSEPSKEKKETTIEVSPKEHHHTNIFHYSNFKWLIYSIIQPAFSNITGVYIYIYYAPLIFQSAGIDNVLVIQIVLVGCTMTLCSIISSFVVSKLSRLLLIRITSFVLIVGTIIVIVSFAIPDHKTLSVPLAVVGTLIFLIGFGFGPACLYYVSLVQDFPAYLKTSGIGFANIIRYIMNAILTFCFPIILAKNGPVVAFSILLVIQIIIFVYCLFFYPMEKESLSQDKPKKMVESKETKPVKLNPV